MKTGKKEQKKEQKQTSKLHDLGPKKDAKGGFGIGGTVPNKPPPPVG